MSLVITTYVPDGIVMASDSRQSITIESNAPNGKPLPKIYTVNSDNVYKTYLLSKKDEKNKFIFEVGVQSFGEDLLGGISIASHIKRFMEEDLTTKDNITTIPKKIVGFFSKNFPNADTGFHVAGYKKEKEGEASKPYVYYCHVARNIVERKNIKPDNDLNYGATWSGQADIITGLIIPIIEKTPQGGKKIIKPVSPIIWGAMPLQDAIDFSIFAIRTTIDTIRFQARPKNVGGPIDVLVIIPEGAKWIQKKVLKGELY